MKKIVRAADRHFKDFGWLKTYWLFSFSDYYDPLNMNWGVLRVFNDDVVAGNSGFPDHPHNDMEIVTIILEGELSHRDDTGSEASIRVGEIQHMSAGTGIVHAEYNKRNEPCHLYQLWLLPRKKAIHPGHTTRKIPDRKNELVPLASGLDIHGTICIESDATIYRADLEAGQTIEHSAKRCFLYLTSGRLDVDGEVLEKNDQMRCEDEKCSIRAIEASQFVLVDC